jgi:hypothetical protein
MSAAEAAVVNSSKVAVAARARVEAVRTVLIILSLKQILA